MPTGIVVLPLLLACLCPLSSADFTPHFRAFLHDHYGVSLVQQLERTDLGLDASFGGRNGDQDNGSWNGTAAGGPRRAVIFVHGIGNKITRFSGAVEHFLRNGYAPSQLYGTTWGDAGRTPLALVDLKCSYVQQIRSMIVAVRQYTGAAVSVVAYSMGSPLARKAILGGNCVDTRQILGPPLTELIDTFVSVAGANFGTTLCLVPVPVGTCNKRTGLHCESTFLADINGQSGYEASYVYSIFSTADEKIGFRVCGRPVSPIRGGTGFVKKEGLTHDQLMDGTVDLQLNFVLKHKPVKHRRN